MISRRVPSHCSALALLATIAFAAAANAGLVNGDFSSDSLFRGNYNYLPGLGGGWAAKNAFDGNDETVDNWQIIDGAAQQMSNSGSATRIGQGISAGELTGIGWSLDFELIDRGISRVQLWAGVDDMVNNDSQRLITIGSDNAPTAGIVEDPGWTRLLEERDLEAGVHSLGISQDLGDYDILIVRFRGNGATIGVRIDNVALTSSDAPPEQPLRITAVSVDVATGMATLTWNSQAGVAYAIDESADLGVDGWPENLDSLMGEAGKTTKTFPLLEMHRGLPELFFRIRVQDVGGG